MPVSTTDKAIWKPLMIGVLAAVLITALLMCISAVILNLMPAIPYGITDYLTVAAAGIGVYLGAYIASATAKCKGLIIGLLCAFVILLAIIAVGLSSDKSDISALTAIRAGVLLLCGAAGGIRGVNRKEHIHIK